MKNAVQLKKPFDTGEVAEVSWAFIRELPRTKKPFKP